LNSSNSSLPLSIDAVQRGLGPLASAFALRILPECASTNSELLDAPPADDGRVAVVAAECQTAGRGRRGRPWQSWPEGSLTFSTLWRFLPGAPVPAGLSLVAGLAVVRTLEKLGVEGLQLKWPNDVLVHGDKLAGILVELLPGQARVPVAVVGIGMNLHLPAGFTLPDQAGVTDLASHLAPLPDRNRLLADLLRELHALFDIYATAGFAALRGAWQQRNAFADLPVRVSGDDGAISGICAGVDDDGALLVRSERGLVRILSGEVSLRAAQ
jgi:BirA family biotin operon repressor/biotin-[acetyl-CoA-carboxylase] ligase